MILASQNYDLAKKLQTNEKFKWTERRLVETLVNEKSGIRNGYGFPVLQLFACISSGILVTEG